MKYETWLACGFVTSASVLFFSIDQTGKDVDPIGTFFYPQILLIGIILFGLGVFITSLRKPTNTTDQKTMRIGRQLGLSLATAIYVLSLPYAGFLIASLIYFPMSSWVIGYRKLIPLTLTSIAFPVGTWLAFSVLFEVSIPRSIWFDRF